jgi:hypothetical protein
MGAHIFAIYKSRTVSLHPTCLGNLKKISPSLCDERLQARIVRCFEKLPLLYHFLLLLWRFKACRAFLSVVVVLILGKKDLPPLPFSLFLLTPTLTTVVPFPLRLLTPALTTIVAFLSIIVVIVVSIVKRIFPR